MTSSRIALVGEHHLEEGEAASRAPVEHPRDTVAVLPRDLEAQVDAFVEHYNHRRYHESLGNLAPADIYFGRDQAILQEREGIKRQTMEHRRLLHRSAAA